MVDFLYDSRYHDAGVILALMGFTVTAQVATSNYDSAYLAAGDSRRHFQLISIEAMIQVAFSVLYISSFGILGAVFAFGLSKMLVYPFKLRVAQRYNVWDPVTDFTTLRLGWAATAFALYLWQDDVLTFMAQTFG